RRRSRWRHRAHAPSWRCRGLHLLLPLWRRAPAGRGRPHCLPAGADPPGGQRARQCAPPRSRRDCSRHRLHHRTRANSHRCHDHHPASAFRADPGTYRSVDPGDRHRQRPTLHPRPANCAGGVLRHYPWLRLRDRSLGLDVGGQRVRGGASRLQPGDRGSADRYCPPRHARSCHARGRSLGGADWQRGSCGRRARMALAETAQRHGAWL
ncbi:MAG: hypothetical protein AVDCRST_MAG15-1700, partial [uncultured Rubellimicrobium sp.]